jgi:hypothetical protein
MCGCTKSNFSGGCGCGGSNFSGGCGCGKAAPSNFTGGKFIYDAALALSLTQKHLICAGEKGSEDGVKGELNTLISERYAKMLVYFQTNQLEVTEENVIKYRAAIGFKCPGEVSPLNPLLTNPSTWKAVAWCVLAGIVATVIVLTVKNKK